MGLFSCLTAAAAFLFIGLGALGAPSSPSSPSSLSSPGKRATATETAISGPTSLATDGHGHLFIGTIEGDKVYRVDLRDNSIIVVAGNGKRCCYREGAKATQVSLGDVSALATDASGNLVLSENTLLRRVDADTGVITTIAGNGTAGLTTDGALALSTSFSRIWGLAFSASGDLFLSDTGQSAIFRLDMASGKVMRVAGGGKRGLAGDGGPARDAVFRGVKSIALDWEDNILAADDENCRIRRIDARTGTIESVAITEPEDDCADARKNNSLAAFPGDIVVDADGNAFFLESPMNVVVRMEAQSHVQSVVAGNGGRGFTGDGGPAEKADISGPSGLAIDADGNLYISDFRNKRVRRVDARTHIITTIAGNGLPNVGYTELLVRAEPAGRR